MYEPIKSEILTCDLIHLFPLGAHSMRIVLYSHQTVPLLTYELKYAECSGNTLAALDIGE